MKKSIFLLGVAVAAMTSCSNDKLLDQAEPIQRAIGFKSWINKPTKAVNDINETNLKEFYVFGYYGTDTKVFGNDIVIATNVDGHNGWDVTVKKLWTKNEYKFAAYANGPGTGQAESEDEDQIPSFANNVGVQFSSNGLSFTRYSLSNKDLIASISEDIDNTYGDNQQDVSLDFQHLLSKVSFKFKYTDQGNQQLKMTVTNVELKVPETGNCLYSTNASWSTFQEEITTYSLDGVEKIGLNADAQPATPAEYYVLPASNIEENAILSFDVTYTDSQQGDAIVKTEHHDLELSTGKDATGKAFTWAAGNIYNYTVNLPFDPLYIDFTLGTIAGWTSNNVTIAPPTQEEPTQGE